MTRAHSQRLTVRPGGSTGIGKATVELLAKAGAKVAVGDINTEAAEQLCKDREGVSFQHCDVTKYDDIYNLFKVAHDKYGRIDHAVSSAGIFGSSTHCLRLKAS